MSLQDFMAKIRYWDNKIARWMMNHFYIIFFQFVLVLIFFIYFYHIFRTLDLTPPTNNIIEQLLFRQSISILIVIVLLILNSFWMLFMFSEMNRIRFLLKDINFNLFRRKNSQNQQ